ncbi:MAG: bacillithiol system redox-active protein YtxJ [Flavobacterium sp.]|uniref:bacillithiol system redox-active protein YtxJ n=1 Tax=Flavobacterium sp. TaxID=239 RepID=UPI001210B559|nr:bacillithiol system redox-active protein YtxJ [Flavobacterium sp.]RZJ68181.1 MAG: bacillithiol system redox-active protein YtxJ [Flavobacterium sp.]
MSFFNKVFGDSDHKDTRQNALAWNDLTSLKQLEDILEESENIAVVIFKHSTRCGISKMSLKGFEKEYNIPESDAKFYFLDLLNHRDISNAIAEKFNVYHESPQLILIRNGKAVFHSSHGDISAGDLVEKVK